MFKIKRRKILSLLAKYRKDLDGFFIHYARKTVNQKIDPDIEKNLIKNKDVPVKYYNYS